MSVVRIAVRKFGPFESAIAKQFADYRAVTGATDTLEIVAMDLNPMHDVLFRRRELATDAWDLAFLSTDWIAEAQASGLVADLRPFMAEHPLADFPTGWTPSLLSPQDFAGGIWGMPYHDGPECLIVRKDLLAAAGLAIPTTWDAFHAAARALHAPEKDRYGTVLALFPDGHNSFYDFCIHCWTRGAEPFDPQGRPNLRTPEAGAALDFIRTLAGDTLALAPDCRNLDSVQSGLLFCAGKIGLMTNWFGFAALAETSPDSKVKGLVDVAPLPCGLGGSSVSLNVFWLVAIAAGSRQKERAWSFLRHLATPDMDKLTTTEGAIGVRRSTWADPAINRMIPFFHTLDVLHERARSLPLHPRLSAIAQAVDRLLECALMTTMPSADLLAAAQADIETLLA
ncbi:extracellular solute-binding protein [Lichenihabitans psoromatis]|uniref:extracellular solute-binding protein n=1 Tax=Lichenihabitans psoromatis TaxID=2528642 RepID=UPI00103831FD|nr:extracellular solute-binding protein [Lichenihabitans psoromatis]